MELKFAPLKNDLLLRAARGNSSVLFFCVPHEHVC